MYEVSWIAKINKKFLLEMGIIIEFENLRGLNFDWVWLEIYSEDQMFSPYN